jgi:hypothetical protein
VTVVPLPAEPAPAQDTAAVLAEVQVDVLLAALADAANYRRDRAGGYCLDCACERHGLCPDHARDFDTADDYDDLADTLALGPVAPGVPAGGAR